MHNHADNINANVDPAEIQKFEELASRWWDPKSEFRPLHEMNPIRLDYIERHAPLKGKKVLDVGCGGGILAESMARHGAEVMGIDMGKAPLEVARIHLQQSGLEIDYRQTTIEDLAAEMAGQFDVITCMEMLEHVPDPSSVVAACQRLLKPGGALFFSTINRNPKAYLFAIIGAEHLLRMLPKGTHNYDKFIRPSELEGWCRHTDLTMQELKGVTYNPLNQQFGLSQDISVNYMAYCCHA